MHSDNTQRFSNRVDNYVKYRPGYPEAIIDYLQSEYNIHPDALIADIGSGTGISSRLFLEKGYTVFGVEPNHDMALKSIEQLASFDKFSVSPGTAENTGLSDHSMDVIVAAQAFHWFNNDQALKEMRRILHPTGLVVLLWNERLADTPFGTDYDELIIRHGIDYVQVQHRQIDTESIRHFFAPNPFVLKTFPNYQDLNFEGLKGRLLSSSYMPTPQDKGYNSMISDLQELYTQYKINDLVRIDYETKMYIGSLALVS